MSLSSLFATKEVKVNPEKDKLLLKVNMMVKSEVLNAIYFDIQKQYESGVVLVPSFMDFAIVPKETEILVKKEEQN